MLLYFSITSIFTSISTTTLIITSYTISATIITPTTTISTTCNINSAVTVGDINHSYHGVTYTTVI